MYIVMINNPSLWHIHYKLKKTKTPSELIDGLQENSSVANLHNVGYSTLSDDLSGSLVPTNSELSDARDIVF